MKPQLTLLNRNRGKRLLFPAIGLLVCGACRHGEPASPVRHSHRAVVVTSSTTMGQHEQAPTPPQFEGHCFEDGAADFAAELTAYYRALEDRSVADRGWRHPANALVPRGRREVASEHVIAQHGLRSVPSKDYVADGKRWTFIGTTNSVGWGDPRQRWLYIDSAGGFFAAEHHRVCKTTVTVAMCGSAPATHGGFPPDFRSYDWFVSLAEDDKVLLGQYQTIEVEVPICYELKYEGEIEPLP